MTHADNLVRAGFEGAVQERGGGGGGGAQAVGVAVQRRHHAAHAQAKPGYKVVFQRDAAANRPVHQHPHQPRLRGTRDQPVRLGRGEPELGGNLKLGQATRKVQPGCTGCEFGILPDDRQWLAGHRRHEIFSLDPEKISRGYPNVKPAVRRMQRGCG